MLTAKIYKSKIDTNFNIDSNLKNDSAIMACRGQPSLPLMLLFVPSWVGNTSGKQSMGTDDSPETLDATLQVCYTVSCGLARKASRFSSFWLLLVFPLGSAIPAASTSIDIP
jgi:hypothetical protein